MLALCTWQIAATFLVGVLSLCTLGFGMVAWGEPSFTFAEDGQEERRRETGWRGRGKEQGFK
jgi:hypothetical protein